MYLIKIKQSASSIQGKGVFADQVIHKNEVVWKFVEGHDKTLSINDYDKLNQDEKDYMDKVAYLSSTSNLYNHYVKYCLPLQDMVRFSI